jgi:ribosomal protein L11 methylase PrmA
VGVVWDVGANTGVFSRIAVEKGFSVISYDIDPAAVEINYVNAKKEGQISLLPLILDVTNPSPGIGWVNRERMSLIERGPADAVIALALIHHLAISNNLPFDSIASFFESVCSWLIIEFIPKEDSQVQRLLASRQDIFQDYTKEKFERAFLEHFRIIKTDILEGTKRTLYLMEKQESRR